MQLILVLPLLSSIAAARPAIFLETPSISRSFLTSRQNSKSASPSSVAANSTASSCSPAVMALASGIQSNIADQNNELATVTALGNVLSQNPMDMTLYAATQSSLLGFVQKGIAIREENQRIAPQGNGAIPGLATVAMAQMTELSLTMSLALGGNGTDVRKANATVESLKGDFKGGIVQNMKNLAAATANCTAPAATGKAAARSFAYA